MNVSRKQSVPRFKRNLLITVASADGNLAAIWVDALDGDVVEVHRKWRDHDAPQIGRDGDRLPDVSRAHLRSEERRILLDLKSTRLCLHFEG